MREVGLDYGIDNTVESPVGAIVDGAKESDPGVFSYELFLSRRWFLWKGAVTGVIAFAVVALLIPPRYESAVQLMPPDQNYSAASMMLGAAADRAQSLVGVPGDLLGVKTSGAVFTKILASQTVEDALIRHFDLRR